MAKTSNRKVGSLSFCDQERRLTSQIKITVLTFLVKKSEMKLPGVSIFLEYAKKLKVKCRPRSRPRPRI